MQAKTKSKKPLIKIADVFAFRQYDSRGIPTIGVHLVATNNLMVKVIIPSGASVGKNEAVELRDNGKKLDGKTVDKAIAIINNKIKPRLISLNPFEQAKIDELLINLDGTFNKSRLGANSILAISIGVCKLAAKILSMPLYAYIAKFILKRTDSEFRMPKIMANIINGGAHAFNYLDFQEFMIVPLRAKTFDESCMIVCECFYELAKIFKKNHLPIAKGDEGGYDTQIQSIHEALDYVEKAIMNAHYKPGIDVGIALDVAASEFYDNGKYFLKKATLAKVMKKNEALMNPTKMIEFYEELIKFYPIISIEDPLHEEAWEDFAKITKMIGKKVMIVGDDLYCTNKNLIAKGAKVSATNAIIIKPNQIGTITETINAINLARQNKMKIIVSHRSGDTEDTFIADFSVAVNADFIKSGAFSRSERLCKYNRLLEIESTIHKKKKLFI